MQLKKLDADACKYTEHLIVSQIMKHLEDQNILTDRQIGFRSKHSCESQLYILPSATLTNK